MTVKFLEEKSCKELRDMAKVLDIQGRWDMKKVELIDAILKAGSGKNTDIESAKVEEKVEESKGECVGVVKEQNETASTDEDVEMTDARLGYIENVAKGTLVAFKAPDGKYRSAKVKTYNRKKRLLKLETQYGVEYIVSYESVVWVKTGRRWPRGVYNLLTGGRKAVDNNGKSCDNARAKRVC